MSIKFILAVVVAIISISIADATPAANRITVTFTECNGDGSACKMTMSDGTKGTAKWQSVRVGTSMRLRNGKFVVGRKQTWTQYATAGIDGGTAFFTY